MYSSITLCSCGVSRDIPILILTSIIKKFSRDVFPLPWWFASVSNFRLRYRSAVLDFLIDNKRMCHNHVYCRFNVLLKPCYKYQSFIIYSGHFRPLASMPKQDALAYNEELSREIKVVHKCHVHILTFPRDSRVLKRSRGRICNTCRWFLQMQIEFFLIT